MPGSPLVIRPLQPGEEQDVVALWSACGLTRPWNEPFADIAFAKASANSDVLVGLLGEAIVASAMVGHDGHRGTMYYVGVDPKLRQAGYGRVMVEAAEAWLKARGVWKVNLLVRKGNEGVLGFYDQLGYGAGSSVSIEKWIDPSRKPVT